MDPGALCWTLSALDAVLPPQADQSLPARQETRERVQHPDAAIKAIPGQKQGKKKFPWLLVALGTGAVTAAVLLVGGKKGSSSKPTSDNISSLKIDMVRIKGGTFSMGSNSSEAYSNEQPAHSVTLSPFYIGKTEVTQGQWRSVMASNPSYFANGDSYPVEKISWNEVKLFLIRLNQQTGQNYRLPTEAEWEYAARGGTSGDRYGDPDQIAWYNGNSGRSTHPVGQKQPNGYGLYDMLGNVQEWCSDWYELYSPLPQTNPQGPSTGSGNVLRGGSWNDDAREERASVRKAFKPYHSYPFVGFRLAKDG